MVRHFICKAEGEREFERPRHRWGGSIKMDVTEIGYHKSRGVFLTGWATLSFSRRILLAGVCSIHQLIYRVYTWNMYHFIATLLMNRKAEKWKLNAFLCFDQVYNSCHLSFQIFTLEALHSQLLKWRLTQKKLNACCSFTSIGLRLQCKGDFVRCLERNRQQKCRFTSGFELFDQTGYIFNGRSFGRRPVTEAQVDTVRAAFVRSPSKSTRHAAGQLNMPHTTVHKILRKRLKFKSCKYQLLQHVTARDK
jgi:hypothetical protein